MIEFNNTKDQTAEEQEELFKALTEKALNREHNAFEYIKNTVEFGVILRTKDGIKKIIELYNQVNMFCDILEIQECIVNVIFNLIHYVIFCLKIARFDGKM